MGNDEVIKIYGCSSASQLETRPNDGSQRSDSDNLDLSECVNIISQLNNSGNLVVNMQRASTDETHQVTIQPQSLNSSENGMSTATNKTSTNSGSSKKSFPSNGKKTKGRVKIKMEYIDNKLRRYTTFSKRKTGIMKKAYELSTLTGTQVMLLVASETGHVYTFATRKLQPMITSEAGKALIQTCLNSPDPPSSSSSEDQRMSANGFEETELTYNFAEDEQNIKQLVYVSSNGENIHVSYENAVALQNTQHLSPSHLVPASNPSVMLTESSYIQPCPSPLPTLTSYDSHMTLSHNQR